MQLTLTIAAQLLIEKELACQLRWLDEDLEVDETFWIPKSCMDPDDWDREQSIKLMNERGRTRTTNIDVQTWWLRDQDWFEEWSYLLED